jgi:uncharacterized protein (DUF2384 family)
MEEEKLISLYQHGETIFENRKKFDQWLNTPNFFLDQKKPKEFLETISGIKIIDDRLTALEFGDNV